MRTMTDKNLHDAFAGESMAHMKYMIYAEKAETEGKPQVARLFKAIALPARLPRPPAGSPLPGRPWF